MGNKSSKESSKDGTGSDESAEGSDNDKGGSSSGANPGLFAMAKEGYEQLVKSIIRPPRCSYRIERLGPSEFDFGGRKFERKDFTVTNPRGLNVSCSIWGPKSEPEEVLPCVVYMHGNSSARIEAIPELPAVLSIGARLLAFDFAGSGLSGGEYVSLGYFEKDDLQCVIEHLRSQQMTSTIALWGRSMGAVTALMHGKRDPSIAGMILDSPFSDLTVLAEELVETGRKQGVFAPGFVVSLAIRFVRSSILERAKFDIKELSPISHVDTCFIPALFAAADGDNFITPSHSKRLCDKYAGDHRLRIVNGDHNSPRSEDFQDEATRFLINTLQIEDKSIMAVDVSSYHNAPPWAAYGSNIGGQGLPMQQFEIRDGMQGETFAPLDLDELLLMNAISLSLEENSVGSSEVASPNSNTVSSQEAEYGMSKERQQELQSTINNAFKFGRNKEPDNNSNANSATTTSINIDSSAINVPQIKVSQGQPQWTCPICTLINDPVVDICQACDTPK